MLFGHRASARDLAVVRVIIAGWLLFTLPVGLCVTDLPDLFFDPPISVAALARGFPPAGAMVALNAAAAVAVVCLLIGYRTPAASVASAATLILTQLVRVLSRQDRPRHPACAGAAGAGVFRLGCGVVGRRAA
jgi:uncharacterized membrane protein YphA (DoxX/SURF4 family)